MLATPIPANLRIRAGTKMTIVESDVYNVCRRIKEIDPSLYVVLQEGHDKPWVVMEMCHDGECRMVSRYAELDSRIIDDLRRMLAIPFDKRIETLQKQLDAENEAASKNPEQWERFIWDIGRTLQTCNFLDTKFYTSFRNVGRKKGGV